MESKLNGCSCCGCGTESKTLEEEDAWKFEPKSVPNS
jgi:hypothetical protein